MDFAMFFVRDAQFSISSAHEEEVLTKRLLRCRVDIFVDAEEPGVRYADAELLLELAGQRRRRFLARHEMTAERVPHPREARGARAFAKEDSTVSNQQAG